MADAGTNLGEPRDVVTSMQFDSTRQARRIRVLLGLQTLLATAMLLGSRADYWSLPDVLLPIRELFYIAALFWPLVPILPILVLVLVLRSGLRTGHKVSATMASVALAWCGWACFLPMVTRY